jgi:phage baseplate assembly protein W
MPPVGRDRRTRNAETVAPFLGSDLRLDYHQAGGFFEDADLGTRRRAVRLDIAPAGGLDNLTQALANRLKTRKGELAPLGHPDYGSRHHELIGEPNVDRTRNLVKLYVLQALAQEPRLEKILSVTVRAENDPPRETVRIEVRARVLGEPTPLNLVVPFSLEAAP